MVAVSFIGGGNWRNGENHRQFSIVEDSAYLVFLSSRNVSCTVRKLFEKVLYFLSKLQKVVFTSYKADFLILSSDIYTKVYL